MELFSKNVRFLREQRGLKQSEMIDFIGIKQSTWGGYETGKSFPNLTDFLEIAEAFGVTETELIHTDLSKNASLIQKKPQKKSKGNASLIASPTASLIQEPTAKYGKSEVLGMQKANVFDFETAAAAGPAITLLSEDKYKAQPTLYMPWLGHGTHVRTRVAGDSMHSTIKDGDYAVSTLITEAQDIRQGYIYMFMDKHDGICYKRLYLVGKNHFELVSDNEIYKPYKRHFNDIYAIFQVREVHTTDLRPYWNDLRSEMREMNHKIREIQHFLKM